MFEEFSRKIASMVDGYIYASVKGNPPTLYEASLHLLRAGGKRLRPITTAAVAQMLEQPVEKALPFAAAVELVHNFALIHDDMIDRDEYRRGVPTVHKVWGEQLAIVAGDLLFAKAFEVLSDALDKGVNPENIALAARHLSRAAVLLAEGQALDNLFTERDDVTVEEYLDMAYRKTGSLFEAAAVLGGLVATTDTVTLSRLAEYGRSIGIAFQIRDDVLGVVGEENVIGKPLYSDIREGRRTILVIYALENLEDAEREELLRILGDRDAGREELERAASLIRESGALDYAERLARDYVDKALKSLQSFPENNGRKILEELASFVVERIK